MKTGNVFLCPLFDDDNVNWSTRSYNIFSDAIVLFDIKELDDFLKLEDSDWFSMKKCGVQTLGLINGVLANYKKKKMVEELPSQELMSCRPLI